MTAEPQVELAEVALQEELRAEQRAARPGELLAARPVELLAARAVELRAARPVEPRAARPGELLAARPAGLLAARVVAAQVVTGAQRAGPLEAPSPRLRR